MVDAYVAGVRRPAADHGQPLGDRYGRRKALALGLVVFGIGSMLSAFAGSAERADRHPRAHGHRRRADHAVDAVDPHQRLPGRGARPRDRHLGRRLRPRASRSARSSAAGSSSHFWWGSVFLVNVPVVIVALIAGRLIVPNSKDPSPSALDPVGAVLSIVGLVSLVYGDHRGAVARVDLDADARDVRASPLVVLGGVRDLGAPQRPPDARRHVLREPAVHRREHLDRRSCSSRCSARCSS